MQNSSPPVSRVTFTKSSLVIRNLDISGVNAPRPAGGTLGELLSRKGVAPKASSYLAEVGQLVNCSFSDAILGYSWMSDAHWGAFPRPHSIPNRTTGDDKLEYSRLSNSLSSTSCRVLTAFGEYLFHAFFDWNRYTLVISIRYKVENGNTNGVKMLNVVT